MKKYKYTGETRDAIKASLAHWKEIEDIIANVDDKLKALSEMFIQDFIGEKTCALCQMFPDYACPLMEEGMHCSQPESPYRRVLLAWINKAKDTEITLAVSGMVSALEGLLGLEELEK